MDYNLNNTSGRGKQEAGGFDEQKIRSIIRDEIYRNAHSGAPVVPKHNHDNVNSPHIPNSNVIKCMPGAAGSITFSHTGDYVFNMYPNANTTPTMVFCNAVIVDSISSPTNRYLSVGSAALGQSYYFQPGTSASVQGGGPIQPFIQTSAYIGIDSSTTPVSPHALSGDYHIADVQYPSGTVHARLVLKSYSNTSLVFNVPYLDSGWSIIAAITVI